MNLKKAKKLAILQSEPNLVFFDEIQSLKNKLNGIQGFLSDANAKEVYNYEKELETLVRGLQSLTESVDSKDMVVNIPLDNLTTSIERVESAIKAIKEVKIPEYPKELSLNEEQLNALLLEIQAIPPFPIKDLEKLVEGLGKKIENIKLESEDKEFDYDFLRTKFDGLIKAIKNISITVSSGGGFPERSQLDLNQVKENQTNGTQLSKVLMKTGDDTYQTPRIDPTSHSLQMIEFAHHKIHIGEHYMYSDSIELDAAATQDYLITTPNTTNWSHLSFSFEGTAITQLDLYEGTDKNGTTSQTILNNNRNSLNTSVNTLHKGVSGGTTDGVKIWTHKSGTATGAATADGVSSGLDNEIILKQNTKYLIRITSGTNDNLVNIILGWYENINETA